MANPSPRAASSATSPSVLAEETIRFLAYHDALTGLPNRTLFQDRLEQALAQARRHGRLRAVVCLDLDRFKQINDSFGHAVGDLLLKQVAQRIQSRLRQSDTVARMGGDEFSLLLPDSAEPHHAWRVVQTLLDAFNKAPFACDGRDLFVTASIGISFYPEDALDAATLQRNADSAMYAAKRLGRNTCQLYSSTVQIHS